MKRLMVLFAVSSLFACTAQAPAPPPEQKAPAEVPITSKSPEAIDHFKKGRDLVENQRPAEALPELDQAIKLDPGFALALAYRGVATPAAEGLADLERASSQAGSASKAEQLVINATLAGRRGEFAKSEDLWKQAADAVPGDWRVHMGRGLQLFSQQKYAEEIEAMNKATQLNPQAGPAFNMLGYGHLFLGESGPAVEALTKYANLMPNEPNPQDSLGEALMADGKFADAEAAFRKAIALSPKFAVSWDGVAYTKFYAHDWAGGREAVAKGREASLRPVDRMGMDRLGAFAALAEGKTQEGLKRIEALATSPDARPSDAAAMPASRAVALVEGGRYRDAVSEAAKTLQQAEGGKLPPFATENLRRVALEVTAAAQGRMGDAAGAEKTVAALQKAAAAHPDDAALASSVHFAQGMLATAQKDMKAAATHFAMCSTADFSCHWQAAIVLQKAGDKAGADAARARLTKIYVRDPVYLYARSTMDRMVTKATN